MWRFKPFMPKEQTGLEGRTIDIGNLKVCVRNAIAEGGFSLVYLARDVNDSKQYALKHIICNDEESLQLVKKEISVMKLLKGHPNVVSLCADTVFNMGRTKEAFLVMEYCEKSLVNVLESRGAGFFEEKQVLTIFRDICNAVFAMHCQSPPISHRDLKAENLLLGSDGVWKLCDFGSISTNHKRFEKPEEMGIEEDNIRKYTTPAYRAPEMWDLFRRELINEKVDIWALGCLLYRICYLKSAFDGESKLQVLNGNYRIPESPKYSSSLTGLITDMLQSSPDARPDITQVWFRVNDLLPDGLQKSVPDRPPEMQQQQQQQGTNVHEGSAKPSGKPNPMPRRSPPPPPAAAELARNVSPALQNPKSSGAVGGSLGAFWNTQHAKGFSASEEKSGPKFDEELISQSSSRPDRSRIERVSRKSTTPDRENNSQNHPHHLKPVMKLEDGSSKDFETNLFQEKSESTTAFQGEAFHAFVAEFGDGKSSSPNNTRKLEKEELLEAEISKLKEQLIQVNMEKSEITSKYEKLSAICRSQRLEIQELKQSLVAKTPSPNKDAFKNSVPAKEKTEGTVWELQQGLFDQSSPSSDQKPWQAFADESTLQATPLGNTPKSVRTKNGHHGRQVNETNSVSSNTWGFGTDKFSAVPNASARIRDMNNNTQRLSEMKNAESKQPSQPAGWAGF